MHLNHHLTVSTALWAMSILAAPSMHLTPRDDLLSANYERGLQQGSQQCPIANAPNSFRAKAAAGRQLPQARYRDFSKGKPNNLSIMRRADQLDPAGKYPSGRNIPQQFRELSRADQIHAFGIAVGFCACELKYAWQTEEGLDYENLSTEEKEQKQRSWREQCHWLTERHWALVAAEGDGRRLTREDLKPWRPSDESSFNSKTDNNPLASIRAAPSAALDRIEQALVNWSGAVDRVNNNGRGGPVRGAGPVSPGIISPGTGAGFALP
ncbi:MAG: hypothetical protein M1816_000453 [Peltula sp. TS41687]|nr:MAG: hypothetical protein M1816_000453 [Peltula sp. TS41687]